MLSQFVFDDGAAFHQPSKTLVLGDLHLGRTYQHPQYAYPTTEYDSLRTRIEALVEAYEPERAILNGDTFDALPPNDESLSFVEDVFDDVPNLTVTVGNHDDNPELLRAALPASIAVATEVTLQDDVLVLHGHRTPTTPSSLFLINHIHPRADGQRCTLYHERGSYNTAVLILPTFSTVATGPEYSEYNKAAHAPVVSVGEPVSSYDVVALAEDD